MEDTLISNFPHFYSRRLRKKNLFLQRDLWDFRSQSWNDWHLVAQEFSLTSTNFSYFNDIIGLIPQQDIYKMNIDMLGTFQWDWEWCFETPPNSI